MNSFQAAGFPFTNADLTKAWENFRLPSLDIEALLVAQRKNVAALASANQAVFDGLKTVVQRQGDLLGTMVNDYGKVTGNVLAGASFEETATKQADAAREIYLESVDRFRELSDIAVRTNLVAVDILNARVAEAFDEVRALFAAPASAVAGPAAVLEEVDPVVEDVDPVAEEVDPVVEDVTEVEVAPTTGRKKAVPAARPARRPGSRR